MKPQEVLVVFFAHALSVKMWAFQDIVAWILCSSENMPGFPGRGPATPLLYMFWQV